MRVPLVAVWPDKIPAGAKSCETVSTIDFYPTLLGLLGLTAKDGVRFDGISLAPVLRDPKQKLDREAVFNFFPHGGPSKPPGVTVRAGKWKLIRWFETGLDYPSVHELYNLAKDMGESTQEKPREPPVAARHISVVKTRHANFFLLDSLIKTMVTQGEIGEQQTKWLTGALDELADDPAIIVTHHNPRLGGDPLHFPGGLIDSELLWKALVRRRHVKAYIHGHIHDRSYAEHQGIQIINTPATSYVADPKKSTTGWTTARFSADGVELTTHTNQADHPWNGQRREIQWSS